MAVENLHGDAPSGSNADNSELEGAGFAPDMLYRTRQRLRRLGSKSMEKGVNAGGETIPSMGDPQPAIEAMDVEAAADLEVEWRLGESP